MWFNSIPFLIFFPIFLLFYWLTKGKARLGVSLAASYVFYGWWDWRFLGLILVSTGVDFLVGLQLEKTTERHRRRRLLLVSLVVNLGILGFFKYFGFFFQSFTQLLSIFGIHEPYRTLKIILPVGISFYTFQTLSYSIDVYHNRIPAEHSLLRFATFVAFFPQLVAGPIVRASKFLPQLHRDNQITWNNFVAGGNLVLWGYVKKVVVADSLASTVDHTFAHPAFQSPLMMTVGVLFYAFQIYCDFSGYSDIAIGLAKILGFDFGINFERPYFSASFREFWRRWHISLSTWLRDYLYIPLGGNRKGKLATYRNIAITMLLGGLWHGANWTFIAWGALHGIYLIVERIITPQLARIKSLLHVPDKASRVATTLLVFSLTSLAWIFFRAQNFHQAGMVLNRIFAVNEWGMAGVTGKFLVAKGAFLLFALVLVDFASEQTKIKRWFFQSGWAPGIAAAIAVWTICFLGSFHGHQFIYFQF